MPSLPQKIGKFQVLAELGRGGMGVVYKVKDPQSGQLAALKMIPPDALMRAESALRFKREFRAMQRVEHPNVIRVFEAGSHEDCPFFTMEFIEGKEIKRWLDGEESILPNGKDPPPAGVLTTAQRERLNEPVRVKKIADAVVQVAYALAEIHRHRIVHRDLKPDNIMVSKAGVVKLMDFGIAKQISRASEQSTGGMVVGTFKYLSPEQALGANVDGRADLYCLGIILYELLAGRHPFYSENSVGYAYHHARKPPPDISKFNPEVHKGLKAVCERLIKKDPRERYPTADDVVMAIRDAMQGFVEELSQRLRPSNQDKVLPFGLPDQLFAPSLVGRDGEQRTLLGAAEQLLAGRGGVAAVTGPRGIGKTRLVREVAAQAKPRHLDFVWGRCSASGGLPYQPYVDVLDHLIQSAADSQTSGELKQLLGDEGRVLARYVPAIDRLPLDAKPRVAPLLDPEGERIRFLSAVTAFLGRCGAAQPRVIVIDDIHRADELSILLTRHLAATLARAEPPSEGPAQRFAPLVLLFTLDPADSSAEQARDLLSGLSQGPAFTSVALSPLSPEEVREMVASMLGGGEVAQALGDHLHRDTGGVPGPIEERIRAWADSGDLRRVGRQWVLSRSTRGAKQGDTDAPKVVPIGSHDLPEEAASSAPEDVVEVSAATGADIPYPVADRSARERRISRLSPLARDVAERAAIAGERISTTLMERIALRTEDEFIDALDELFKREMLFEDKGEAYLRFVDPEDRKACLQAIPLERSQHLHLLVARAIEEDAKRHKRKVNPEEQARHYLAGGDVVRAIEQLMQAARLSLAASATQTAAQRVGEAQELVMREFKLRPLDQSLMRCDVELVLLRLDVLAAVNIHGDCVALAKRRLPRLRGSVENRLVCEMLLRLAASERFLGELDAALEHVGEVLATTERGGNHALRCRAKSLCGLIYEHRGQFGLAERYYNDALELARAIDDDLEEERARAAIAQRRLTAGDLEAARADFERLLNQAEQRGEKLRIIGYVSNLGIIAHEQARYDDAEVAYRRMLELAKPTGDRRSLAIGHCSIAMIRRDQGRFSDALSQCERAARILKDLNQADGLSYVRIAEAQTLLDRAAAMGALGGEDDQAAFEKSEEAFDLAERASSAIRLAEASICRGQAHSRLGRPEDGASDVQRGLGAARAIAANRLVLFGLSAEAERCALNGNAESAARAWREAMSQARSTGFARFITRLELLAKQREIKA